MAHFVIVSDLNEVWECNSLFNVQILHSMVKFLPCFHLADVSKCFITIFFCFVTVTLLPRKKGKNLKSALSRLLKNVKACPETNALLLKVARFSVSTKSAQANASFGDELATMLTSALQQTSCFRVMETNKNVADATGEMAFLRMVLRRIRSLGRANAGRSAYRDRRDH